MENLVVYKIGETEATNEPIATFLNVPPEVSSYFRRTDSFDALSGYDFTIEEVKEDG